MRRSARFTGTAVAMAAALLLSGCGSSDDEGKDENKPSQEDSQGSDNGGQGDGPENAEPGSLTGIWTTKVDGKDLILSVVGDGATLVQGDTFCTGRVTDAGKQTLTLKCPNGGGEERTNGSVDSVDSKSLTVTWNGGDTDTFDRKAEAPSDLPTGLDGLEKLIPDNN